MKYKLYSLLFLVFINISAQSIEKKIKDNISRIESLNLNDASFLDLDVIGKSIGDAKIVFLGEQNHGDATAFEAKTRIIKYLHEKKGFNILAFESDFFNINKKSDENKSIEEIEKSIFAIWSNCTQVNPLFQYIKNQKQTNPIIVSGFDSQIFGAKEDIDKLSYLNSIENYIEENIETAKIQDYKLFKETLKDIIFYVKATEHENAYFKKKEKGVQKKFFNTLHEIISKIDNKETFLFLSLKNALSSAKMAWEYKNRSQERDIEMGKNILWLHKKKFPHQKIIIWAHNFHIIKNNTDTKKYVSAGNYVSRKLEKSDTYSIGFTSRKGETHMTSLDTKAYKTTINEPKKNGFENWIHSKKIDFGFINFRKLKNNSEKFHMRNIKRNWLNAYDGIFYIDNMYPCIKEKKTYYNKSYN